MTLNTIELWRSFLQGDNEAFEKLYHLFSDPLYRYGMKFIANDDIVKDCIQDVFVKIYHNRANLSETENPKLYLLKALKNKLIDRLAADRKHRLEQMSPQDVRFYVDYYQDPQDETDDEAEIREKFDKVMSLLTDRQKEALYLRFQMEVSYQDISLLLDINYQSARNLVHRAIEKVRAEMNWSVFLVFLLEHVR